MDESQLLNYDSLPASARAEADAYLAEHPDAARLVAEGRALHALLGQAARFGAEVPDTEALAQFVTAQFMAHRPLPPEVEALGQRIHDALAAHPELERQYSMMLDRLRSLTDAAESPHTQFERLVGYSLTGAPSRTPTSGPADANGAPAVAAPRQRHRSWRAPADEPDGRPLLQRLSFPRLALAASLLLALLYGSLFLASNAEQTEWERLANLEAIPSEYEGLRLRGVDGGMDPAAERYAAALDRLNTARSSTLGLFPAYDEAQLDTTVQLLRQVTELDQPDAALGLEAWYLIGRVLLYRGDVAAARDAFQIVVERQGPSTPDARRLLDALPSERVVSVAVPPSAG